MKVHQYYTDSPLRNYNYFVEENETDLIAVDPLFPDQIDSWLKDLNKNLSKIIITHEHPDHINAYEELKSRHGAKVIAHSSIKGMIPKVDDYVEEGDTLNIHEGQLEFMHTPGHTPTHICLLLKEDNKQKAIITMDTVFNAGVGHCKLGGTVEVLHKSIERLISEIEDEVILYPGHDYIENNLKFTLDREPSNERAKELLSEVQLKGSKGFLTTMKIEKEINTFFRLSSKDIINNLKNTNTSRKEVFISLRALRDNW